MTATPAEIEGKYMYVTSVKRPITTASVGHTITAAAAATATATCSAAPVLA